MIRAGWRWAAVAAWMGVIVYLTLTPKPLPFVPASELLPYVVHFVLFGTLTALVLWAASVPEPLRRADALGVGSGIALLAGLDEVGQHWVRNRTPSILDWGADLLGICIFAAGWVRGRRGDSAWRESRRGNAS